MQLVLVSTFSFVFIKIIGVASNVNWGVNKQKQRELGMRSSGPLRVNIRLASTAWVYQGWTARIGWSSILFLRH